MPKFVFVISSMRSGSTLLKALLATRKEVVDIKETPFSNAKEFNHLAEDIIVVLKQPSHFHNVEDYPQFPNQLAKKVVLVRNPYDTIISLVNMMKVDKRYKKVLCYKDLIYYWNLTYYNILNGIFYRNDDCSTMHCLLVKYEILTKNPIVETSKLFKFIDAGDKSGTEHYNTPKGYKWEWGSDDGGEIIGKLKIQNVDPLRTESKLLSTILNNPVTQELLRAMEYESISPELIL